MSRLDKQMTGLVWGLVLWLTLIGECVCYGIALAFDGVWLGLEFSAQYTQPEYENNALTDKYDCTYRDKWHHEKAIVIGMEPLMPFINPAVLPQLLAKKTQV